MKIQMKCGKISLEKQGMMHNLTKEEVLSAQAVVLRTTRAYAGLSQSEIATELGTTKQAFSSYETGKVLIPLNLLINYGSYIGKAPKDILGDMVIELEKMTNWKR